jgi:hypothetical protein
MCRSSLASKPLRKVVNTNVCDAVLSGRFGPYALLASRDRLGRTAVYSRWLAFPEINAAEAFLRDFPRFGLNNIERRSQEKLSTSFAPVPVRGGTTSVRWCTGHG